MFRRTKKKGDGVWRAVPEGLRHGQPMLFRSRVHPHKFKRFVFVDILAFDLRNVALRLVAGTDEPVSSALPKEQRPAVVALKDRSQLLAVFNGGFKARHGNYGTMLGGTVLVPPRDDACTVGADSSGRIHVAPWSAMAAQAPSLRFWRQTPPCLLRSGKLQKRFNKYPKRWGVAANGDAEIRRSAIGTDASGRVLFYGFGDWLSAAELARAMKRAGAEHAAQLDINWSYTRFFLFDEVADPATQRIKRTIIPKLKFNRKRYLEKRSYRDFFYVVPDRAPDSPGSR